MSIGWLTNITVEDTKFESTTGIKIVYKKRKSKHENSIVYVEYTLI